MGKSFSVWNVKSKMPVTATWGGWAGGVLCLGLRRQVRAKWAPRCHQLSGEKLMFSSLETGSQDIACS